MSSVMVLYLFIAYFSFPFARPKARKILTNQFPEYSIRSKSSLAASTSLGNEGHVSSAVKMESLRHEMSAMSGSSLVGEKEGESIITGTR